MRNCEIRHYHFILKKDSLYLSRKGSGFNRKQNLFNTDIIEDSRYVKVTNPDRYRCGSRKEIILEWKYDPVTGYKYGMYKNYDSVINEYTEINFE